MPIVPNGWRYGLVKADHYRPVKEQNLIQPLLTIPLVSVSFLSVGGAKLKKMEAILFYLGWLIVTTIWTLVSKESKKEAVGRYCFTFIFVSVIYYFACVGK